MAFKIRNKVSNKLTTTKFLESKLPILRDVLNFTLFLRRIEENDDSLRRTSEKMWTSVKDLRQKANNNYIL